MGLEAYLDVHQKIDVTVWRETDDEGFSFASYIKDLRPNQFLIEPPSPGPVDFASLLKPGYLVGVALVPDQQNPVLFYPRIQAYQGEGLVGFWLAYTEQTQVEIIQRRRHARVNLTVPLQGQAWVEADPLQTPHWMPFEGISLNLSGGGMRFVSPVRFQHDQMLKISFRFSDEVTGKPSLQKAPEAELLLNLKAKVVFSKVNLAQKTAKDPYITSVSFLDLNEQQETRIVRECFRRELKARRIAPHL